MLFSSMAMYKILHYSVCNVGVAYQLVNLSIQTNVSHSLTGVFLWYIYTGSNTC